MWLVKWSLDRFIIIFFFLFLQIILGNVNVSILNRTAKVQYKDDYEKFKLILNGIGLFMAIINLSFSSRLVHKWGGGEIFVHVCCIDKANVHYTQYADTRWTHILYQIVYVTCLLIQSCLSLWFYSFLTVDYSNIRLSGIVSCLMRDMRKCVL